jgi:hypothetical protein
MKCDIFNLYLTPKRDNTKTRVKNKIVNAKTPKKSSINALVSRTGRISVALAVSTLVLLGTMIPGAKADQYDDQINALQGQNNAAQSNVDALQAQD